MSSHLALLILTLFIHQTLQSIPPSSGASGENGFSTSESFGGSESSFRYAPLIAEAVESGIQEAKELFETIEPNLYAKNIIIPKDHPALFLAAINHQTPRAKELSRYAYALLRATLSLKEQLSQLRNDGNENYRLSTFSLADTPLEEPKCPIKRHSTECSENSRIYRTADGTCNNFKNPTAGSSFQPFARYLPPEYDDGVSTIRKSVTGNSLPSARKISTHIHKDVSIVSSAHTLMLMQWGEFLDHDLTLTAQTRGFNNSVLKCCREILRHPDCLPIPIPSDDLYYNGTMDCMEFIRSSPSPRPDCRLGAREQLNQLTSWLDGSVIYGSTEEEMRLLRLYRGGKLRFHHMSNRKPLLPRLQDSQSGECRVTSPRLFCFRSGDARVNEHPGLAAMHTIWLRQHNSIAQKLAFMNPQWSEETTFQETRKIVVAQLQHITLREFLPLVLGPTAIKTFGLRALRTGYYDGHNGSVDGTVPNAFGSAAFRFGHSLVEASLPRWSSVHHELPYRVNLSMELMSPSNLHNLGEVDWITLGLTSKRSQRRDEFITADLTNHLFKTPGHKGLDLAAINIQRGRDHGLPPYLRWRDACGLLKPLKHNGPLVTWEDFAQATGFEDATVKKLVAIYENPWDIDLFPGGMLELSVRGGLVGATFACIIGQTFRNIRKGDRFWYENPGHLTPSQLQAIRNISLARVLCDTSDSITSIQPIVFLAPELQKNPSADCSNSEAIPLMDFLPWNQVRPSEDFHSWPHRGGVSKNSPVVEHTKPSFYSLANYLFDASLHGAEDDDPSDATVYKPKFLQHHLS